MIDSGGDWIYSNRSENLDFRVPSVKCKGAHSHTPDCAGPAQMPETL